jgi:hypothetical protein
MDYFGSPEGNQKPQKIIKSKHKQIGKHLSTKIEFVLLTAQINRRPLIAPQLLKDIPAGREEI